MCMCVSMCVYICVYICVYMCVCVYICAYIMVYQLFIVFLGLCSCIWQLAVYTGILLAIGCIYIKFVAVLNCARLMLCNHYIPIQLFLCLKLHMYFKVELLLLFSV